MNLRLPVLAAVVAGAGVIAGVRALHHDAASASTGFTASSERPPSPTPAALPSRRGAPPSMGLGRVTVYVAGDVARAGVYTLAAAGRAVDALRAAGGPRADADLVAVNLAEPLVDGEEIVVPRAGETRPAHDAGAGTPVRSRHGTTKRRRKRHGHRAAASNPAAESAAGPALPGEAPAEFVDLNTADENELETLPGIGPSLAERIVAFREANGRYASPDDLLDVGGMTQGRLDAIEPYVTTR